MPDRLAVHGGRPTVTIEEPHFTWPEIDGETERHVVRQLHESISIYDRSGAIGRVESKLQKLHGRKHAVLFNSGTMALYAMYVSLGLGPGDEVICPAYTFFATVTPLLHTGAVPILADCDAFGNIDPEDVRQKISEKTKAIVGTHMWGYPANTDQLAEIAKNHDIPLLEDGSHAHLATRNGALVGSTGHVAAFSLQGQKTLTGGEGGYLITDDDEIYYRSLALGHYNKRCRNEIPKSHELNEFARTGMGLKLRIHPLSCAIIEDQLEKIERAMSGRRRIATRMISELSKLPGIRPLRPENGTLPSWYALIIQYDSRELHGLSREAFVQAMDAEGCHELDIPGSTVPLNTLPLFQKPETIFPEYENVFSYSETQFENAKKFSDNIMKIPVWHKDHPKGIVNEYIRAFSKVTRYYHEKQ